MPVSFNPSIFQTSQRPDTTVSRETREPVANEPKEKRPDNEGTGGGAPATLQTRAADRGSPITKPEATPLTANRTQEPKPATEAPPRNLNNGERDIGRLVDISV